MTKKVAGITQNGITWEVIYDESKGYNPYIIRKRWFYYGWHTKKITAYANLQSAILHIANEEID